MVKLFFAIYIAILMFTTGCGSDDNNVNPPSGEVLLAEAAGDSVGTISGSMVRITNISSLPLDFTDRNNIRISFYYSGENNLSASPFRIYYNQDSLNDYTIFYLNNLNVTATEQFKDTTFTSPGVNKNFYYMINANAGSTFAYFKFRDLKIYKK